MGLINQVFPCFGRSQNNSAATEARKAERPQPEVIENKNARREQLYSAIAFAAKKHYEEDMLEISEIRVPASANACRGAAVVPSKPPRATQRSATALSRDRDSERLAADQKRRDDRSRYQHAEMMWQVQEQAAFYNNLNATNWFPGLAYIPTPPRPSYWY